ncbi:MAG: SoxR reducing system RseC family protein [Caldisericaceae bacterium]
MKGTGTVKAIKGDYIEVVAPKESECKSCALKESCSNNSLKEGQTIFVNNTIGAKVGDYVEFEFRTEDINRGFFIVYGIPLIFIIVGTIIGSILENRYQIKILNLKDFTTFFTTMIFLAIGIVVVKFLDAKEKPKSNTTRIISRTFLEEIPHK